MPALFPLTPPPSSFLTGLRAVVRASEKRFASAPLPTACSFSTCRAPSFQSTQSCLRYNVCGVVRPSPGHGNVARRIITTPNFPFRTLFTFRAITQYTDLPDTYRDAEGLPFRREDLSQKDVNAIFPSGLPAPEANLLLKILHGRRVAGTLDDPQYAKNTLKYRIADQKRALAYLREHIPVDEVLNAGLRAEDELMALESTEDTAQDGSAEVERIGDLPRKSRGDSPYGESNFDRIRAQNIAKREAEEARIEEERRRLEEEMAKGNIGTLQTQIEKPREISPWRQKHIERATSTLEAPPEMPAWKRLAPIMASAVLIVLGSAVFAVLYSPPSHSQRLLPDIPPAAATCLALIAANAAIWALWKFPPAWGFFNKYMIVVAATPKPFQLIGATFSHHTFTHLLSNMTFLWFFGTRVHDEIGRGNFLALYFSSGALGYLASLTHAVLWRGLHITSVGASGAVYGLIAAFFWIHRFDEFKILGFPPDPISGPQGLGFLGLIIGAHILGMFRKKGSNVDIASHFGGMLCGVLGVDLIRSHRESRARVRAERLKSAGVLDKVTDAKQISPAAVAKADAPPSSSSSSSSLPASNSR
ncbi:rhomboid-domain-containing protein [Xylariaceae sp. FL0594]|nr:rhomboid-domain-containing protein [Xylariaceae sp. FL0594]